jgi:hypothetical protein
MSYKLLEDDGPTKRTLTYTTNISSSINKKDDTKNDELEDEIATEYNVASSFYKTIYGTVSSVYDHDQTNIGSTATKNYYESPYNHYVELPSYLSYYNITSSTQASIPTPSSSCDHNCSIHSDELDIIKQMEERIQKLEDNLIILLKEVEQLREQVGDSFVINI